MKRKRAAKSPPNVRPPLGMDEQAIDALYGLEPVFEPDTVSGDSGAPTQFTSLSCPYCGESFITSIDLANGSCTYVEDCQVCCQAMELVIELDAAGAALQSLTVRRLD